MAKENQKKNKTLKLKNKQFIGPCVDALPPNQRFVTDSNIIAHAGLKSFKGSEKRKAVDRVRAAFQKGKIWQKNSLEIAFLNGTERQKEWVEKIVMEKLQPVVGIKLRFNSPVYSSDIRISFSQGGAWSYIGTDCAQIPTSAPTMNLGWLDDETETKSYFTGQGTVILHEFGHALGMIHEHQNPEGNTLKWNEEYIYRTFSGPPNNWNKQTIYHNILKKYNSQELNSSQYDIHSIMHYFFPKEYFLSPVSIPLNANLSATDKLWLNKHYPTSEPIVVEEDVGTPPTTTTVEVEEKKEVEEEKVEVEEEKEVEVEVEEEKEVEVDSDSDDDDEKPETKIVKEIVETEETRVIDEDDKTCSCDCSCKTIVEKEVPIDEEDTIGVSKGGGGLIGVGNLKLWDTENLLSVTNITTAIIVAALIFILIYRFRKS